MKYDYLSFPHSDNITLYLEMMLCFHLDDYRKCKTYKNIQQILKKAGYEI